ncbi:hypothetical protein N7495_001588 [Penicillium taxi]|uniref:uncharacterized protein n=1 Tax=Penicillium taxi TaxID=168475 RepID=UPI002545BA44|nr:uncharacterized protein N7495_001588 [Penicillium taxi]KAJ5908906.1 hypothetical protein N7495_001588 [Penicillium taxi]
METQDSVDIFELQRVALEHEPIRPFDSNQTQIDSPLHNRPGDFNQCPAHQPHSEASVTINRSLSTPSSKPASSTANSHPPTSSLQQYDLYSLNSNHTIDTNPLISRRPITGKMDSADSALGDTQVVSQSIYDNLIRQNGESMTNGTFIDNGADGATLRTLHEGDSGHLDLLAEFDSTHREVNLSPENDDESSYDQSESSPIGFQPEFFPESQRFLSRTPGTAVKKIHTPGTTETPTLSRNPLAGEIESSGGIMGLSQLFKATQAPSSPLVHGHQPELVSDRPSPNVPIQQPRIFNAISSPLAYIPTKLTRDSSEPNLNYISLNESQGRRDKSLGRRLNRSADDRHDDVRSDDPLEQEFYKESSFVEKARRQRQIHEETAVQFAALSAPARSKSSSSTSRERTSPERFIQKPQQDDILVGAAGSEEETEQETEQETEHEEDIPQVPQSQQSMEEDKENYDRPPAPVEAANSAHDRLSQILEMATSQSSHMVVADEPDVVFSGRDSIGLHIRDQPSGRSSQVMVKDSQQSPPQSSPQEINIGKTQSQPDEMQLDPPPVVNFGRISPVRQSLQSSPPGSRPENVLLPPLISNSQQQQVSNGPERDFVQNTSSNERHIQSSNPKPGSLLALSQPGPGGKTSSMTSHVIETPDHQRLPISDAPMTSVPETSPTRVHSQWEVESNGDGLNNEDDDLPPMFSTETHRATHAQLFKSRALSSPIKGLQSQAQSHVLSSPSGRQRRALTEIASDCSPQADFRVGDISMEFFTADDDHFNSLVIDGSPTRPKKRRRGNQGQSFFTVEAAAAPTIPATPYLPPPKTLTPVQEGSIPESPMLPEAIHIPPTTIRKKSRLSRRTETIWEIESSPQQPMARRSSREVKSVATLQSEQPPVQVEEKDNEEPRQSVAVHDSPSVSSELTEVDFDSEDMMIPSENYTASSLPTTPVISRAAYNSDDSQVAPHQVFAIWMGHKRAYFPATCLGAPLGVSKAKYMVKLEDSAPIEVVKGAVKRLELRIGDAVKVDMHDVPKVTHIIRGLDDKLTKEELDRATKNGLYPQTDIYGHTTVILGPKQRKSLPNGGLNNSENTIKVPICRIYMDTILWNQFKDRSYTYQHQETFQEDTSHTSFEKSSLPVSPGTRFSHNVQLRSGIFSNMAFAVSYKEDDGSKIRISKLITDNGGSILHDGFTELFEPSSMNPLATPKKGLNEKGTPEGSGLRLTSMAENVGFTCLIADSYSRREKYMQALALGLPCLSGRWVEDCVAKGHALNWDIYLLPAGDSMYLHGATKSRVMTSTPASEALLSRTIATRPKLLDGHSVLIITGRGKAEEKRKAYIFLTLALGASRVERVPDLQTAKLLLESQMEASLPCSWDFVYVDDADQASARSMLTPRPKTQRIHLFHGSRKRKKSAVFTKTTPNDDPLPAKVVGNEFVCQSLILGRLYEE